MLRIKDPVEQQSKSFKMATNVMRAGAGARFWFSSALQQLVNRAPRTSHTFTPPFRRTFATPTAEQPRIRLGSIAPNFTAKTTNGDIDFHQWANGSWVVLFSHPADFTPVCTTELGAFARMKGEFDKRGVKMIGLVISVWSQFRGRWVTNASRAQMT